MVKIKKWYIYFLDKDNKKPWEVILYFFLYFISLIYGLTIYFRNFFYDKKIIKAYHSSKKVISVGNISWSGSGKTPFSILLYQIVSTKFKVAVLRRGYGMDEGEMLKEKNVDVFSCKDRRRLVKSLEASYDVFILDDGFQYRKLNRDINIVLMGAREFKKKHRLIPAYFFREPLRSLKRADIVILHYKNELNDPLKIKKSILKVAPDLEIFFSQYKFQKFIDLDNNEVRINCLVGKKIAAFAAIGYPEGFFSTLKELDLNVREEIIYPDHYKLSQKEFNDIQERLLRMGISYLIITHKDKYHLPDEKPRISILIMEVEIELENRESFMRCLFGKTGLIV